MTKMNQMCTRCIIDTTDPEISFDREGVCNHCHNYDKYIRSSSYLKKKAPGALEKLVGEIRAKGEGKKYDCIIGVSGGIDSTYTAYLTKELGLRPLAIHLDNGWDSELAVSNIEKILKKLNIDLFTLVLDWEEFKDLQLAFLKASTPDSEIPTDHAIVASLFQAALREKIPYILIGRNTATEGIGVAAWSQGHGDWKYIKTIQKRFGTKKLKSFPHYGPGQFIYYNFIKKIYCIPILDYIDYDKKKTLNVLQEKLGWRQYGQKHYESVYTRFFQGYILPKKFGFDKKKDHLSALIRSGQMFQQEALEEMNKIDYPLDLQMQDREFVIKKFNITEAEFENIMNEAPKSFWDYPSYKKVISRFRWLLRKYRSIKVK